MEQDTETNERGNQVARTFVGGERYIFDFHVCASAEGWQQFDTDQDASYFGVWVHPERREITTFAEGDLIRVTCPTEESYRAELQHMCDFYGTAPAFTVIDPAAGTITEHYQDRDALLRGGLEPEGQG